MTFLLKNKIGFIADLALELALVDEVTTSLNKISANLPHESVLHNAAMENRKGEAGSN